MKIGKTLIGAVVAAVGYLSQPGVFDLLPERVAQVVVAAGAVLSIFGLRHAVSKNGTGA